MSGLGLYRPGATVLHRAGAGGKLLALLAAGVLAGVAGALTGAPQLALSGALALAGAIAWLVARLPVSLLRPALAPFGVLLVALAAVQWWSRGPEAAAGTAARLVGLLLLAVMVSATTRVSAILDAVIAALGPLRRLGVPTERIGLAVALAIRAIPVLAGGMRRAREARIARQAPGGLRGLPGLAVPTVVSAMRTADAMGDALVARGGPDLSVPDHPPPAPTPPGPDDAHPTLPR